MIKKVVPNAFINRLKSIDRGLFVVWDNLCERYQVMHKDDRTGLVRCIIMIENEDGSYRPCDERTVKYLEENVAWETLHRYPEPKDMVNALKKKMVKETENSKKARDDYRKQWNKEHRRFWKTAIENMRSGIHYVPQPERSIIFSTSGVTPGKSTGRIIVPLIS